MSHRPVLAVDLGGTNMRAAIVAADGTVRARTPPDPTMIAALPGRAARARARR